MASNVIMDDGFPEGIHLCHIFNDENEREKTMASFFASGIKKGEKVMCIVDSVTPHDVASLLKTMGIELDASSEVFAQAENDASYCPNGVFDPDSLLNGVGDFYRKAKDQGFNGARISGDMAWVLRHDIRFEALVEYEIKVLEYLKTCPFTAICEYDARKFDGVSIMNVLKLHPATIIQGQVMRNPFYVEPSQMLSSLKTK